MQTHALPPSLHMDQVSGTSLSNCAFVVCRVFGDRGRHPDTSDAVLYATGGSTLRALWHRAGWFGPVWCSDDGTVFAGVHDELGIARASDPPGTLTRVRAPVTVHGVWGLHARCVFAWGRTPEGRPAIAWWDGNRWSRHEMPGSVHALHGLDASSVYACGDAGLIARWDGAAWRPFEPPCTSTISSVHVLNEQRAYATAEGGLLLEGTPFGWRVARHEKVELHGLGHLGDRVIVAHGTDGLVALTDAGFEVVKPKLEPRSLDARAHLLFVSGSLLLETSDGVAFRGISCETVAPQLASMGRMG